MSGSLFGGKGVNLVRLAQAGVPVPKFVIVPTTEYDAFVSRAGLSEVIDAALDLDADAASNKIQAAFHNSELAPQQRARLAELVTPVEAAPVAVRSSATAEDLPDASFAGQQDTYLNIEGADQILAAIIDCWASLWTPRAISYRQHNDIPTGSLSLAVVVQTMVQAEASGVMFTANPLTGNRTETVIDATFGLGEALVSGQVIPDNYVLDTAAASLKQRTLAGSQPALSMTQLTKLCKLGVEIADLYGQPQDIEWVRVGDEISIVQSRAITSLFPIPGPRHDPRIWFSVGAVQGMLAPITPLGRDQLSLLAGGIGILFGAQQTSAANAYLQAAGQRLWIRLDATLKTKLTRKLALTLIPLAEPGSAQVVERLAREPRFAAERTLPPPQLMRRIAGGMRRVMRGVPQAIISPARYRHRATDRLLSIPQVAATRLAAVAELPTPGQRLAGISVVMEQFGREAFGIALPAFGPIMITSAALLRRIQHLAARTGISNHAELSLGLLRALDGNVTTEMDLLLADTAVAIRGDAPSREAFSTLSAPQLAAAYEHQELPAVAQQALSGFLSEYGMRGLGEIDLGAPRWTDDPTGVCQTLIAYVTAESPDHDPRRTFEQGRVRATDGLETLAEASTAAAARQLRFAGSRVRSLFGARETPKFALVCAMGSIRKALLDSGAELVTAGNLDSPADIFYLQHSELAEAFDHDWRSLVAERKEAFAREQRRQAVPRIILDDGEAFYDGVASTKSGISGMGVSPGVAEGLVRVVDDPRTSELKQGEVMVCRGTDPAWTPLFLTAAALVTEVGGLMTHGSVVAREYGIPAVVGVHEATTRLQTGQLIRIDGSAGTIELLDDASDAIPPDAAT